MTAARATGRDRAALAAAALVLLLAGALVPGVRPVVSVLVVAGWWLARVTAPRAHAAGAAGTVEAAPARVDPAAVVFAAVLPLAVVLTWPWLLGADAPLGDPACRDPFSVIALRRLLVAAAGLALVAAVGRAEGWSPASLGLARPARRDVALALAACLALVLGGLFVGPWIARPFFGELDYPVPVAALVPAALFGVANGVLEEVLYRGALQSTLARLLPVAAAIAIQGLAFGIVHAGPEVVALLPVHIALLSGAGVALGVLRWRLRSLWVPVGIHVGADVALYVGLACRAAA